MPFTWLIVFGDDTKTAYMETGEGRLRERACHPDHLNFRLQLVVDDLGV